MAVIVGAEAAVGAAASASAPEAAVPGVQTEARVEARVEDHVVASTAMPLAEEYRSTQRAAQVSYEGALRQ